MTGAGRVPRTLLVYQMGKVGSQTVAAAGRPVFAEVVHTHDHAVAAQTLARAQCVVVTGVREPVARSISACFENISREGHAVWYFGPRDAVEAADMAQLRAFFLDRLERHFERVLVPWFDGFRAVTGVCVEDIALVDGHGTVTRDGREVHLYKVEALGAFLGHLGARWGVPMVAEPTNVAADKWVGPIYRRFRDEVRVPGEVIQRLHALPWVRHCYSAAELAAARRRFGS